MSQPWIYANIGSSDTVRNWWERGQRQCRADWIDWLLLVWELMWPWEGERKSCDGINHKRLYLCLIGFILHLHRLIRSCPALLFAVSESSLGATAEAMGAFFSRKQVGLLIILSVFPLIPVLFSVTSLINGASASEMKWFFRFHRSSRNVPNLYYRM